MNPSHPRRLGDLSTPALVVDQGSFDHNLTTMAAARPARRLRPHVKAHKSTALAARQVMAGHSSFTCATPREVVGMATAGVGDDLLLANETLDPIRLQAMRDAESSTGVAITVAIDSLVTLDAAVVNGIRRVLVDVNVGLPRCGVAPSGVPELTRRAVDAGLTVRGVMGYEGHLMALADRDDKRTKVRASMETLLECSNVVRSIAGAEATIVSAGGTGTFDLYDDLPGVDEVQAGSYALMDTHYGALGLPFRQALFVVGTVISTSPDWSVVDVGLKSLGMDHGNPTIPGASVWFCSDEHTTFSGRPDGARASSVGQRVLVTPAHVDPTVAMHADMWLIDDVGRGADATILDRWPVDLRGW